MNCAYCANPLVPGSGFCTRCGQPVAPAPQAALPPAPPPQGFAAAPPSPPAVAAYAPPPPAPPLAPTSQAQAYPPPPAAPQYAAPAGGSPSLDYRIDPTGAFALAVLRLQPEQSIKAEAGAMVSMSRNVEMQSQAQGGLVGVLKRAAVGESAFINTFTARGGPGELTLAPSSIGDIVGLELNNQMYFVQSGSFLASAPGIQLDLQFGGAKSFFAGEGLFLIKLWGMGTLLLSSFGAIRRKQLAPGESYLVDTGHIVAFEASVQYTIRKASQQGFWRNMASGEGYVCEYVGPGEIFLQTRNLASFAGLLRPFFPNQGDGGGLKLNI